MDFVWSMVLPTICDSLFLLQGRHGLRGRKGDSGFGAKGEKGSPGKTGVLQRSGVFIPGPRGSKV